MKITFEKKNEKVKFSKLNKSVYSKILKFAEREIKKFKGKNES